jgi:hypothetical protein
MKGKIEYRVFPWGIRIQDFEKTLKDVEVFVNRPDVNEVISVINTTFGVVVWYKAFKSLRINLKKP